MTITLLNYPVSKYEYYSGEAPSGADPLSMTSLGVLGEGAFSKVEEVKASNSEETLAVKFPKTQIGSDCNNKELAKLRFLSQKEDWKEYIIELVAFFTVSVGPGIERIALLFRKYRCSLANVITSPRTKLAPRQILKATEKLLKIALFLKKHKIIHRDIKPANILVDYEDYIKLADFAFAVSKEEEIENTLKGTPDYLSPELLSWNEEEPPLFDFPSDMWAVACTIYEVLSKNILFHAPGRTSVGECCFRIRARQKDLWKDKTHPTSFEHIMQEERNKKCAEEVESFDRVEKILRAMLTLNPQERLTPELGLETFFPSL